MLFYHKGLGVRKTPLPLVACARKAAIRRGQIWSAHESDVVGLTRQGAFPGTPQHRGLINGMVLDAEVCEQTTCAACGHKGRELVTYTDEAGDYRAAVGVCPECHEAIEV